MNQRTSTAATLAIVAAIGSYLATCAGHPVLGLVGAIISIPLGVIGLVISTSARVRGGGMSILAIVLGAIGLLLAILGIMGVLGAWMVS